MSAEQELRTRIQEHRTDILRAELAAHLHVMGRMRTGRGEEGSCEIWKLVTPPDWTRDLPWNPKKPKNLRRFMEKECPLPGADDLLNSIALRFPSPTGTGAADEWPLGFFLTLWKQPFVDCREDQSYDAPAAAHLNRDCRALALFQTVHVVTSEFKKGPQEEKEGAEKGDTSRLRHQASVFGHEVSAHRLDADRLRQLVQQGIDYGGHPDYERHREFLKRWHLESASSPADFQKPIYDIDNWTYGDAVAAFFKTAVARLWAAGRWPAAGGRFEWHFLSVGCPGLEYLASAVRITDVIARRKLLSKRLDAVRHRLEYDVPIAHEIYRDENGAIFLVAEYLGEPPVLMPLAMREIQGCIEAEDDLHPHIAQLPWDENKEIPPIWSAIESLDRGDPLPVSQVEKWWGPGKARNAEVCPVCGLRPQAGRGLGQQRELCSPCLEGRREQERCATWARKRLDTIWIDEAADANGICALLTGSLDLTGWLKYPWGQASGPVNYFRYLRQKHPDFMRLRSCWETTRAFWEQAQSELAETAKERRKRLRLELESVPADLQSDLVYETSVGGAQLSVVWTGREFLTASNLEYVAKAAEFNGVEAVRQALVQSGLRTFTLPRGYEKVDAGQYQAHDALAARGAVQARVTCASFELEGYSPYIPLVAEPRHFFLVGPASESIHAVEHILDLYHTQFGKVAGMLPVRLGLVFFDRRTPIYAVMQAGRKMLRMPGRTISSSAPDWETPVPLWRDGKYAALAEDEDFARVRVDAMGESKAIRENPSQFLYDLSSIDFLHLETTGHRYRLAYGQSGRLDPDRRHLPLTVERFLEMQQVWETLRRGLHTSQIHQVFAAIEAAREDWDLPFPVAEPVFERFVRAILADAEWRPPMTAEQMEQLVLAAQTGLLREAIEVYTKVLKQRGKEESAA